MYANSNQQAATTRPTPRIGPLSDLFEADLFEVQIDDSPSQALRDRIASHLYGVVSEQRVMRASRFRLLHWMLAEEERRVRLELVANELEVAA